MVRKAFRSVLLIQIIAGIVGVIGMVVDGAVTGSCLGTEAMAGFGLAAPVVTIFVACSGVCELGASMLIGRFVGARKMDEASEALSSCLAFSLILSLLMTGFVFIFSEKIAAFLGANGTLAKQTVDYLRGFSLCAPALLMLTVLMPERAAELREVFKNGSDFRFVRKIWPDMQFISGVGGDGFSVYADTIRRQYADESVKFILGGVTSSEGLWSVPVELESEDASLVPGSAFMEFLPVDAGDDFTKCVSIDKLEVGKVYELIITNLCGFYRYRMSDALLVTGFFEKNTAGAFYVPR